MSSDPILQMHRWRAMASTWTAKAVALLRGSAQEAERNEIRWLVGYEAERLLSDLLAAAEGLVPLLNPDQDSEIETLRRDVNAVAKALRNQALAPKLAEVSGRTPAEAASFTRRAREMAPDEF